MTRQVCSKALFPCFGNERYSGDLERKRMGIASDSSILTELSFVIKNLENLRCAGLLANRKPYLLFILNQSQADT